MIYINSWTGELTETLDTDEHWQILETYFVDKDIAPLYTQLHQNYPWSDEYIWGVHHKEYKGWTTGCYVAKEFIGTPEFIRLVTLLKLGGL